MERKADHLLHPVHNVLIAEPAVNKGAFSLLPSKTVAVHITFITGTSQIGTMGDVVRAHRCQAPQGKGDR